MFKRSKSKDTLNQAALLLPTCLVTGTIDKQALHSLEDRHQIGGLITVERAEAVSTQRDE